MDSDVDSLLTKERADAICEAIADGLNKSNITGSANVIGYAIKIAWMDGFREGKKHATLPV